MNWIFKHINWLYLLLGIIAEVIATSSLTSTKEFSKLWPSVFVLLLYGLGLFFLTLSLRTIPVGIAYAIWAGMGIVLVTLFGFLFLRQKLDVAAVAGICFIIAGVLIIHLFSKSVNH